MANGGKGELRKPERIWITGAL